MFNLNIQLPGKQNLYFLWYIRDWLFKFKSIESLVPQFFSCTLWSLVIGECLFRRSKFPLWTDGHFLGSFWSSDRKKHYYKTACSLSNDIGTRRRKACIRLSAHSVLFCTVGFLTKISAFEKAVSQAEQKGTTKNTSFEGCFSAQQFPLIFKLVN